MIDIGGSMRVKEIIRNILLLLFLVVMAPLIIAIVAVGGLLEFILDTKTRNPYDV